MSERLLISGIFLKIRSMIGEVGAHVGTRLPVAIRGGIGQALASRKCV